MDLTLISQILGASICGFGVGELVGNMLFNGDVRKERKEKTKKLNEMYATANEQLRKQQEKQQELADTFAREEEDLKNRNVYNKYIVGIDYRRFTIGQDVEDLCDLEKQIDFLADLISSRFEVLSFEDKINANQILTKFLNINLEYKKHQQSNEERRKELERIAIENSNELKQLEKELKQSKKEELERQKQTKLEREYEEMQKEYALAEKYIKDQEYYYLQKFNKSYPQELLEKILVESGTAEPYETGYEKVKCFNRRMKTSNAIRQKEIQKSWEEKHQEWEKEQRKLSNALRNPPPPPPIYITGDVEEWTNDNKTYLKLKNSTERGQSYDDYTEKYNGYANRKSVVESGRRILLDPRIDKKYKKKHRKEMYQSFLENRITLSELRAILKDITI